MVQTIATRMKEVLARIRRAEQEARRPPHAVNLLAVSKGHPVTALIDAYQAGQRHFGENYLQEALAKQRTLGHFAITWHFIGPIQSNKTKTIASHFAWVHSVDRWKIAERLDTQRPDHLPPLNVCLQVNISGEKSKSGVSLDELPDLVAAVRALPRLRLRGVMAIPAPSDDPTQQRQPYRTLYRHVQALDLNDKFDAYSYGMSDDLEAAIAEGATWVRIGTALFGPRRMRQ